MAGRRFLAGLLLVACAPVGIEETGQEIIGGSYDTGKDPAVGLLIKRKPGSSTVGICSASMITRRVVLTAAHCSDDDATIHEIWFADSYDLDGRIFEGQLDSTKRVEIAKWVHPRWGGKELVTGGYDIALLAIDPPLPESIRPLPWARTRLTTANLDDEIRIVGFGHRTFSSTDLKFIKLTADNTLSELNDQFFQLPGPTRITCQGDSGGPAFRTVGGREVVAGITSYGDTGCSLYAAFTRVDSYTKEIDAFIAQHDPQTARNCGADGECGYRCPAADPDCPCAGDGFCGTACTNPDQDPDCPLGCKADSKCVRQGCPAKDPDCGDQTLGAACANANECTTGVCAASGSGRVCSQACSAGGSCPSGTTCTSNLCLAGDDSGGCAIGGSRKSGAGWLSVVGALLLLIRRRRRP